VRAAVGADFKILFKIFRENYFAALSAFNRNAIRHLCDNLCGRGRGEFGFSAKPSIRGHKTILVLKLGLPIIPGLALKCENYPHNYS